MSEKKVTIDELIDAEAFIPPGEQGQPWEEVDVVGAGLDPNGDARVLVLVEEGG